MKIYASWLLLSCALVASVVQTAEMGERVSFREIDAAITQFDSHKFGVALSNFGPLCIFAKMILHRDLINRKQRNIAACKHSMWLERQPYALAELGVEAVVTFLGGCFSLAAGGAIMLVAHQERDSCSCQWISYPTGFVGLLCSICAFYRFYKLHAQENTRRAAQIEQLQRIAQRITNDAEAMLSMIANHPLKVCCSELSWIHTET